MLSLLRATIGIDVREISLPQRAPHLGQPALFVHSSDDRAVAIEEGLDSAAAWPCVRHVGVEGLGPRRLLNDPAVVAVAIEFVTPTA